MDEVEATAESFALSFDAIISPVLSMNAFNFTQQKNADHSVVTNLFNSRCITWDEMKYNFELP